MAHVWLRLVDEGDADFILSLRMNADKSRYMSSVDSDLELQVQWLRQYRQREIEGREYYFIIESYDSGMLGTVRVYGFEGDAFSWGSWMLKTGSPHYAAIESALAVYEFSFDFLKFERSYFEVRKDNERVIEFHKRSGAQVSNMDDVNVYFSYEAKEYAGFKNRYSKFFGNQISK